ncbi:MAG: hypothetical protein WBS24_04760 [Terriglobales bacterium]
MRNFVFAERAEQPFPLGPVFLLAFLIHAPLLLMKLPLKSFDTNFHIFFASHYAEHWFDPWNPKWYAGFSQTTYPPLPQQWVALISRVTGLEMAYMLVQFVAILLLALGVYRFSALWVSRRAASYAALASVLLGSESFLVYSAGQLPTTFAAPLYLNALPYIYGWIRRSDWRALIKGSALAIAAAAAHHFTLLFGSVLFAVPVVALAILDDEEGPVSHTAGFVFRIVLVAALVGVAIAVVLLPFWMALLKYPVTQVPIPHPSRANYLLSPEWGLNYFVVPYGAMILAFPFILLRGSANVRLRPLLIGFWVSFLLGLGGTTPVARLLLGRAFEVLTMERFTYWATIMALPFVGLLVTELLDRRRWRSLAAITVAAGLTCALAVAWATWRPADADYFKTESVAAWLNRDGHDRYRYVTLGFGNKIARLAVQTDASSVDGEWNSGRMLPELTEHGAAALTSSKYFGKAGLDALSAILHHADRYGLKWVFVRDPYYEPLLVFAGWRRVDDLENRTVTVWSKDGVPPATPINSPQRPLPWQGLMWGILPMASCIIAMLVMLIPDRRPVERSVPKPMVPTAAKSHTEREDLMVGRLIS